VQLNPAASAVLVIFYLVLSLVVIALLLVLVMALVKLNAKLEALESRLNPMLDKAEEILTVTSDKVSTIGDRTEEILSQGEAITETVHDRVDRTSIAVQRTIHAPLIGLNSLAAGLTRGLHTFSRLQQERSPLEEVERTDRVAIPAGATSVKE
jgi:uncharacterized protein YoxC